MKNGQIVISLQTPDTQTAMHGHMLIVSEESFNPQNIDVGHNVFRIDKNEDGTFTIEECCDNYFKCDATKEQLLNLAKQIEALANT